MYSAIVVLAQELQRIRQRLSETEAQMGADAEWLQPTQGAADDDDDGQAGGFMVVSTHLVPVTVNTIPADLDLCSLSLDEDTLTAQPPTAPALQSTGTHCRPGRSTPTAANAPRLAAAYQRDAQGLYKPVVAASGRPSLIPRAPLPAASQVSRRDQAGRSGAKPGGRGVGGGAVSAGLRPSSSTALQRAFDHEGASLAAALNAQRTLSAG